MLLPRRCNKNVVITGSPVFDKDGKVVKNGDVLQLNDEIVTRLYQGEIVSIVTDL